MRSRDRRQDILQAAIQVFAEKGYYTANVSDVARQAGVAQGTIYLYFKSKEELLLAIFNEKMGELIDYITEQVEVADGAEARLDRLIRVQFEQIAMFPELTELILVELRQSGKFLHSDAIGQITRYLDLIESVLRDGIAEGLLDANLNVEMVATMIYASLEGLATRWVLEGTTWALDGAVDTVKSVLLDGIRAKSND